MDGFFKVHRKILESQVFAHQTALKIWIWCLAKVTYKERFITIKIGKGEQTIKIMPGQFLFGRFKAEEELNIDGSTIYRWIQKFSDPNFGMINIESNNQYSIITVCNWEQYQNGEDIKEQPMSKQRTTNEQPTSSQRTQTRKNKNVKKEKNIIPPTFEMVKKYCDERKNGIDPQYFIDKNTAIGWTYNKGKNKIVDWQAHIRTWEKYSDKKVEKLMMP